MTLVALFPEEDYRFQLRFERADLRDYFQATPEHERLVTERRSWLERAPQLYAALLPEGIPFLDEALELATEIGTLLPGLPPPSADGEQALQRCLTLGTAWEPDFLLLRLETTGAVRLVAGCVCFPSSWSLEEKIGRPIEAIHGVVPGLNRAIGLQIHGFLTKLRPGVAWLRSNWGLSRSADLNQHPIRALPPLDATVQPEEVWLRVEHQALVALPRAAGILFGIRIVMHRLSEVVTDRLLAARMARALRTMPEDMARYKNLAGAREKLVAHLEGFG
jgi:hypothetical protein